MPFYERVLDFKRVSEPGKPTALVFGDQKINILETGHTFEPKAAIPTPGAGDPNAISKISFRE